MQIVRAGLSVVFAALLTTVFCFFLGALLPIWILVPFDGMQAVQDAPGHGGAILFATLPIAALLSIPAFAVQVVWLYQKVKSNASDSPSETEAHRS